MLDLDSQGGVVPSGGGQTRPEIDAAGAQSAPVRNHALSFSPSDLDLRRQEAVIRRFKLQNFARELLPQHRIRNCFRAQVASLTELYHHAEFSTASYGGLQTCGSPHVCPVCSAKIIERRAAEVTQGATTWIDRGGGVLMATFTLRHSRDDDLAFLFRVLRDANARMRNGKAWIGFATRYGLIGSITATEYTYGRHGWHPHLHTLMLVRGGLKRSELVQLEEWLKARWSAALDAAGGYASWDHGVKVQLSDENSADYISKAGRSWTLADELTKANSKLGRRGSLSVPQLLWAAGHGDGRAADLFRQYAAITARKAAVYWSPRLRAKLNMQAEKPDEAVAQELVAGGRLMLVLCRDQWRVVLGYDDEDQLTYPDARAELLLEARAGDVERVIGFLADLGVYLDPWQFDPVLIEKARRK